MVNPIELRWNWANFQLKVLVQSVCSKYLCDRQRLLVNSPSTRIQTRVGLLPQSQILGNTRGSKEVSVLYKKELHDRVHFVCKDIDTCYVAMNQKRSQGTIHCNLLLSTCLPEFWTSLRITIAIIDDIIRFATEGDLIIGNGSIRFECVKLKLFKPEPFKSFET